MTPNVRSQRLHINILLAGAAVLGAAAQVPPATPARDDAARLRNAAGRGAGAEITTLLEAGIDINAADDQGRTALHFAAEGGHLATVQMLLDRGADPARKDHGGRTALDLARKKGHDGTAAIIEAALGQRPDGNSGAASPDRSVRNTPGQTLNPSLKYPDLPTFEKAIAAPGTLLKSDHVWFFAPRSYASEAQTIFPILTRAYDELRTLTGVDTEYIIVIYNFPKGHAEITGGTSNCTIRYDDTNLRLNEQPEWQRHKQPHVSGYIEELAHNFVSRTRAQFGWEMIGWSLGAMVTARVAGNPVLAQAVKETRRGQLETLKRYRAANFTFPSDLPANQVDRIHAALLWQSEQKYGPRFWPDFFHALAQRKPELDGAARLADGDQSRNERYRITIECFDQLPRLNFRKLLEENGISTTVDVKSLHPTEPGWNRRLK